MRDGRRQLWIAIIVLLAGCQAFPTGMPTPSGLTDADRGTSADQAAVTSNRTRALFGMRETTLPAADSEPTAADEALAVSGPWDEDEALRMVLEHELADVSPDERTQWLTRLAAAPEGDIPRLLAERRQRSAPLMDVTSAAAVAVDPQSIDGESAQQIILTDPRPAGARPQATPEPAPDSPDSPAEIDWASLRGRTASSERTAARIHPLLADDAALSVPNPLTGEVDPVADVDTPRDDTPADDGPPDDAPGFVARVYDVFGIGGEREAATLRATSATGIQPAGAAEPVAESPDSAARIDLEAAKALQSVYWQEDLDKLIALLEAQVSQQTPGDSAAARELYIRQHVALRMLYLIASRRAESVQAIPEVPQDDQEFWTKMFWALSSAFDDEAMPNSGQRAAETIAQLREATRQLEAQANLQLQRTVLCRQINGFGDYTAFERNEFTPGQPVLVYTEVRNFHSQSTPEGDYRTVLRSRLTIHRESVGGTVVFDEDLAESEDRCRSRRQDYFHSFRIQLPAALEPGPYVLTLAMTDTQTGKTGKTTLNFVIR